MSLITTDLDQALSDLKAGKPVAIPTETVYGLAAMIDQPQAIQQIFTIKKRPLNHPLIVHIHQDFPLESLVQYIPDYAKVLIKNFWPGPLTLVFQAKLEKVHSSIRGGQTSVAIRAPAHPLTQRLLQKLALPLVAPSANPFGKISPTTALHVQEAFLNQQLTILDGGRCEVGIESTILDARDPERYQILRPGIIDELQIAQFIEADSLKQPSSIRVPGAMETHYQPQKKLYYFEDPKILLHFCQQTKEQAYLLASKKPDNLGSLPFYLLAKQPKEVAFELYYQLRKADESSASCIIIELPPASPSWQGVRERILKAGQPLPSS